MSDSAIIVENLCKQYKLGLRAARGRTVGRFVRDALSYPVRRFRTLGGNGAADRLFWALRDVSFEVAPGEVVGIIGPNGAGKSTLLKILSQITEPTRGRAVLRGRVASLLEVGTGFHRELTGRENVYLNGAILGMRKVEIDRKFDEIIAFAEVDKFIDTPVKHYSSGMYVRLAFAVAAHLQPEILLVDEVLAVGDVAFQNKCLGKMDAVSSQGRTVLFVSHNMAAVKRLCSRVIRLHDGRVAEIGESAAVVENYMTACGNGETTAARASLPPSSEPGIAIRDVRIVNPDGEVSAAVEMSRPFSLIAEFDVNRPVRSHRLSCGLYTSDGVLVLGTTDADCRPERMDIRPPGRYRTRFTFPPFVLNEGRYLLDIAAGPYGSPFTDFHERVVGFTVIDTSSRRRTWMTHTRKGILGLELPWEQHRLTEPEMVLA